MSPGLCSVCHSPATRPVLIRMCCKKTHTHWHEQKCYERCVHRAGNLLQAAFLRFREIGFDQKIKKVQKVDDILHITEDEYQTDMRTATEGPLFPFPDHLVQDSEDKAKVLTYNACCDALGYVFEFSQALLDGKSTTGEEFTE